MNKQWAFYHEATGIFSQSTYGAPDDKFLAANTPANHLAIEGRFDTASQRIDIATGEAIDYQPPQPTPDHEWGADKRWHLSDALVEKLQRRKTAQSQIVELEQRQLRPMRELVLDPGNVDAKARVAALDVQIAALRSMMETAQ